MNYMPEKTTGLPVNRSETPEGEVGTAQYQRDRRGFQYSHMCRDEHEEIGHNDSEHEQCPLCRAIGGIGSLADALLSAIEIIRTWHGMYFRGRSDVEKKAWEIYRTNAPEMKALYAALLEAGVQSPAPPPNGSTAEGTQGGK